MSCVTNALPFSVPHKVCGKARSAGNIEPIDKGRNTATGLVRRALKGSVFVTQDTSHRHGGFDLRVEGQRSDAGLRSGTPVAGVHSRSVPPKPMRPLPSGA